MNESIHAAEIASEPQNRSSGAAHSIEVPPEIVRKWQEFVNLLAEIMQVPSASIMRAEPPHIKVFVSSSPGAIAAFGANHHLRQSLVFLNVPTLQQPEAYLSHVDKLFDEQGKLVSDGTGKFLQGFMQAFAKWVETVGS